MTIEKRNTLVEKYLYCIDAVIWRNAALIKRARLDKDDVYQSLALALIEAVDDYSPLKGELEAYILACLNRELTGCAKPKRRAASTYRKVLAAA